MAEKKTTQKPSQAPKPKPSEEPKNAVANKPSGNVVSKSIQDMLKEDAEKGQELVSADQLSFPFLSLLQSGSPQVKARGEGAIEGANESDMLNIVTEEVYSGETGIKFLPVWFEVAMVEWVPQPNGQFVARFTLDEFQKVKKERNLFKDDRTHKCPETGNEFKETHYHYGFLYNEQTRNIEPIVIPFNSTKLKISTRMNTVIMQQVMDDGEGDFITMPRFYRFYKVTTVPEHRNGFDYYNFNVKPADIVGAEDSIYTEKMYIRAKEMYESFKEGSLDYTVAKEEEGMNLDANATGTVTGEASEDDDDAY